MKKLIVMAAAVFLSLPFSYAQDSIRVAVKPYGFIRNYYTFDSRQTYTVVGGEYNLIPYDEAWNADHSADLNAVPQGQLQALSSRFGLNISGPHLWGWAASGKLEGDFGGFGTNNTVLRLRLAYVKFEKNSHLSPLTSQLVIGQDWHPLSGDIMPDVLGMAAGAPFRPHSRTPQVRATRYWSSFGCTAALLWQLQYMNNGPKSATDPASAASIDYFNHALLPEAFVGVNYRQGPWYAQAGLDAQVLRPRTHAPDPSNPAVVKKVDERLGSLTPTLYAQYVDSRWSVKLRTLLASNTSHLNQMVGYAVTGVNYLDGSWVYSPMRATISYLNIACRPFSSHLSPLAFNLFLGYMKNLGCRDALHDFDQDLATPTGVPDYRLYMKGGDTFTHLDAVWRVAPSVSYNLKAFNLGLEYEVTACTYGDLGADGAIVDNANLHRVVNHRLCALVKYNF